jgi:formylglycine-generating enzyme required for sulfatase activity
MTMLGREIAIILCLMLVSVFGYARADAPKPKDGPLGMKFVSLPKGTFYMGWNGDQGKVKKTEIKQDFEIAIHTVTQGQWQELMNKNPSQFTRKAGGDGQVKKISDDDLKQFPVENVSWNDAQEFIKKLNEKEQGKGYLYRLPTDEEWEYASRGGATTLEECSYHYYFEEPTNDLSSKQANFDGNSPVGKAVKGPSLGRTVVVGSYPPNKLGLYDMHGNVWQWTDASGPPGQGLRGGSWCNDGAACRAGFRSRHGPSDRNDDRGFRLVRVANR